MNNPSLFDHQEIGEAIHLPKRRATKSFERRVAQEVELRLAGPFQQPNDLLRPETFDFGERPLVI